MTPDDFVQFKVLPEEGEADEWDGVERLLPACRDAICQLVAELERQSAALFEDAQCEADSHWDDNVRPVDADALVLGGTYEEGWDWCCLAHLPANLPPERVIWRLTA